MQLHIRQCPITRAANVGGVTKQRQQSTHPDSPGTGERAARGQGWADIKSPAIKENLASKFEAEATTSQVKNSKFWQNLEAACSEQLSENPDIANNNAEFLIARAKLIVENMVEELKDSSSDDINRLFSELEPQLSLPDNGILQLVKKQDKMPEKSAAGRCFNLYFNPIRTLKAEILVRLYDATDQAEKSTPSFDLGAFVVDDDKAGADKIGWTDLFLAASCIEKTFKTGHFDFEFTEASSTPSYNTELQLDWLSSLYQQAKVHHSSWGDKESDDDLLGWYTGKAFNKRQTKPIPVLPVDLASGPAGGEFEERPSLKLADRPAGSLLIAPPNLPKSAGVTDKWWYTNKVVLPLALLCVGGLLATYRGWDSGGASGQVVRSENFLYPAKKYLLETLAKAVSEIANNTCDLFSIENMQAWAFQAGGIFLNPCCVGGGPFGAYPPNLA